MRSAIFVGLAVMVLLFAGCAAPSTKPPATPPAAKFAANAPWWTVGDYWVVHVERGEALGTTGRPANLEDTYRLVNMWNDSGTHHFWLGVTERDQALEQALFDTNPFLGRIHHEILAPHERGMHAGMYEFPLENGDRWNPFMLGGNWSLLAEEAQVPGKDGLERGFKIRGSGDHARTIEFNYVPSAKWFTRLEIRESDGSRHMKATVTDYGRGATGQHLFLRGVDLYVGLNEVISTGTREETFQLTSPTAAGVAAYFNVRATGPATVEIVDPAGDVQFSRSITGATGGSFRETRELPAVQGQWKARYIVTTGEITVDLIAVALEETARTL